MRARLAVSYFSLHSCQQGAVGRLTKHPGGGVHARLDVGHPRDGLKVADELGRLRPCRPGVDRLASPLQQMQLIKRLQTGSCKDRMLLAELQPMPSDS